MALGITRETALRLLSGIGLWLIRGIILRIGEKVSDSGSVSLKRVLYWGKEEGGGREEEEGRREGEGGGGRGRGYLSRIIRFLLV